MRESQKIYQCEAQLFPQAVADLQNIIKIFECIHLVSILIPFGKDVVQREYSADQFLDKRDKAFSQLECFQNIFVQMRNFCSFDVSVENRQIELIAVTLFVTKTRLKKLAL